MTKPALLGPVVKLDIDLRKGDCTIVFSEGNFSLPYVNRVRNGLGDRGCTITGESSNGNTYHIRVAGGDKNA